MFGGAKEPEEVEKLPRAEDLPAEERAERLLAAGSQGGAGEASAAEKKIQRHRSGPLTACISSMPSMPSGSAASYISGDS